MFIDTPPITLSCTRTGANAFPNEHLFVIPALHQAAGTPAVQPGDFCVVGVLTNQNNNVAPVRVVPAGFTLLATSPGTQQNGNVSHGNLYAKILTAADIGATKSTTNPTENGRIMCATFQMNRPVLNFSSASFIDGPGPMGGDPPLLTVGAPGNPAGTLLIVFMGLGESGHTPSQNGIIGSAPYNASGTDDTGTVVSSTRTYYSMYPFGVPGVGAQFNMPDAAALNANWELGLYFILT